MFSPALAVDRPPIPAPELDYLLLSPLLVVAAAALIGVLVEAFCPRGPRFVVQTALAGVGALAALVLSVLVYTELDVVEGAVRGIGETTGDGSVVIDGPGVITWMMLAVFGLLGIALFADRRLEGGLSSFTGRAADAPGSADEAEAQRRGVEHTEVFPLAMFALLGMMIFATSNDLLTMFVALEILSLPLYLLCGLARRRRLLSQEAAMKYFLLGAFSSVFFLYGAALAYGYAGTFSLAGIEAAVAGRSGDDALLLAAVALMAVGLLFKIGAVPFHAWTPDVYQGAPTPVTAFMSAGTKAAAFIALMRVLFVSFGGVAWDWRPVLWVVAAITMVVGSLIAIAQSDVKRMLAYSSVAHAGFLLVGVSGAFGGSEGGNDITSVSSVLFYLTVYGLASIGAFAVVMLVRDAGGEATHVSRWAGLGRDQPLLAGSFAIFMLSFAGIPLTGGFVGKWGVFAAAWSGGYWPLVVIGVVTSAIAAFFYVRMIVVMFFTDAEEGGPTVAVGGIATTVVIVLAAVGTVALGVLPGPALDLVQHAGAFVR